MTEKPPIPRLMRTLERDRRGYPVPFIVLRDKLGTPHFTVNDTRLTEAARRKRLCSICGKRLEADVWFVGGSRCFLHEHGAFVDGPVHHECGAYALQVCPFLAMPTYTREVAGRTLRPDRMPDDMLTQVIPHMAPFRPERFGFGRTRAYRAFESDRQGWLFRVLVWDYVEWWHHGEQVNAPDTCPADAEWHGMRGVST